MKSLIKPMFLGLILIISLSSCDKDTRNTLFIRTVTAPGDQALAGATVTIFSNQADFDVRSNAMQTKVTPNSGELEFAGLREDTNYWVYAEKGPLNSLAGNPVFRTGSEGYHIVRLQ